MNEVIQGWRVGAVYKSESGELFTIKRVETPWLITSDGSNDYCWFDIRGNQQKSHCPNCKHGNLTNLIDTNTTTYRIRGKE